MEHGAWSNCCSGCSGRSNGALEHGAPNPGGDGVECSDVDECSTGFDNCEVNADCTNLEGGFQNIGCSEVPLAVDLESRSPRSQLDLDQANRPKSELDVKTPFATQTMSRK